MTIFNRNPKNVNGGDVTSERPSENRLGYEIPDEILISISNSVPFDCFQGIIKISVKFRSRRLRSMATGDSAEG